MTHTFSVINHALGAPTAMWSSVIWYRAHFLTCQFITIATIVAWLHHVRCSRFQPRNVRFHFCCATYHVKHSAWQVELSEGQDSKDFFVAARVAASEGCNPEESPPSSYPASGGPPSLLRVVISGLSRNSDFSFRIVTISRYSTVSFWYSVLCMVFI